jgi:ribonuclease R
MSGDRRFRSFDELRRALGGQDASEPPAPEPPPDPLPEEAPPEEEQEDLALASVRELLARTAPSFGPMETGPPCYRTIDSEEMELLASFRIRTVFPPAVLAEVAGLPADPGPSDLSGRADLRGEVIFTIDGDDARDFDDAIGIRPRPEGGFEVGVHIADVGHYVRPGTALDREALARATSVYLPDQVVPMLPEALSNNLCSLNPHRDRLAFSVILDFDERGEVVGTRIHKSVIRSVQRCTYRAVQKLLDGSGDPEAMALRHLETPLRHFQAWTRRQQEIRDQRGSLRLQTPERKFQFNEAHEVVRIHPSEIWFSQALIEETALAANQAVGRFFRDRKLPSIYRIHPEKDPGELAALAAALKKFGIRVPDKERLTGRDVARLILEARRRPNADALIARIMGLVERATYEMVPAGEAAPHWGLAREHYLHFTSPIRRYPDLVVHRWLHDVLTRGQEAEANLSDPLAVLDLCDIAGQSSAQAELAALVETAIGDLKTCQYMERHRGERLRAVIQRVSAYGLEVLLREHYVTGFLPARLFDGKKRVDGPRLEISSRRGSRVFVEGEGIDVVITDVDFLRLQVLLALPEAPARKVPGPKA